MKEKNILKDLFKFTKFSIASIVSAIIDLLIFTFISSVIFPEVSAYSLFIATTVARVLATLFNFFLSKHFVFKIQIETKLALIKYYFLAVMKMLLSWLLVLVLYKILSYNETVIKIPVDCILFFVGYILQKIWVFKNKESLSEKQE